MRPVLAGIIAFACAGVATSCLATGLSDGFAPSRPAPELHLEPRSATTPVVRTPATRVSVEVPLGDQRRAGWLTTPTVDGRVPGVVLLHGAGAGSRDDLAAEAAGLAARGVAVLVLDKPRDYSLLQRDFGQLADEAALAVAWLASQPGVDPAAVGLMAWSEGGWVAPIAASAAPDRVAFVVLVSAPVVTPLEQAGLVVDRTLGGVPAPVRAVLRTQVAGGRFLLGFLDHDVRPALARMPQPVMAVWGADDGISPIAEAAARLASAPGDLSALVVAGAAHEIPADQADWLDRVAAWIARPGGNVAQGSPPTGDLAVPRMPAAHWSQHPALQLTVGVAAAAAASTLTRRRHLRTKESP